MTVRDVFQEIVRYERSRCRRRPIGGDRSNAGYPYYNPFSGQKAGYREGALPPGSSVVFISSGRGHGAAAGLSPYGTAKAALNHFAAMLAQDVGPRGVRVNVVSPGYIETASSGVTDDERRVLAEHTALRRLGVPNDVAGAVLFFASDLSAFITGQWLQVNGGG